MYNTSQAYSKTKRVYIRCIFLSSVSSEFYLFLNFEMFCFTFSNIIWALWNIHATLPIWYLKTRTVARHIPNMYDKYSCCFLQKKTSTKSYMCEWDWNQELYRSIYVWNFNKIGKETFHSTLTNKNNQLHKKSFIALLLGLPSAQWNCFPDS